MDVKLNSLTLMSLNVRGIRDSVKRKAVFLFCKRSEADLILLQETHSSESDIKFWKGQWGNGIYCSHGTNHSAGVSIFLHRFRGDILEVVSSDDGRWLTIVIRQDNAILIVCNVYGHNSRSRNKGLFSHIVSNLKELLQKYSNSLLILGGDFNECADDAKDRYPPKICQPSQSNNLILNFCCDLSLTDAWRFLNPDMLNFTWSNRSLSCKSRIDLFLISTNALHLLKNVSHSSAPLSDHKQIILKLGDSQETANLRGYWKFNNSLLQDVNFNDSIKKKFKKYLMIIQIANSSKNGNTLNIWLDVLLLREVKNLNSLEIKKNQNYLIELTSF